MRNRDVLLVMFERTVAVWPATVPKEYVDRNIRTCRLNNSPDNVGHRRGFVPDAVLQGRVFVMTIERNQPIPSGKRTPIPVNTEAVRKCLHRNREWPKQMNALVVGEHLSKPLRFRDRRSGQLFVDVWGSNRMLLGNQGLESNRKRLSANKGTGEAQPSMVVVWIDCSQTVESLPMRRSGGGAFVVVRGRESRPHGEGTQNVSFWTTEKFIIGRVSNER